MPLSRRAAKVPVDAGFTLVEAVVAIMLFAVMSTAVLSVVMTALRTTGDDAARVAATNLAVRELEITRDTFSATTRGPDRVSTNRVENPSPLPGGTAGRPLVVDGTPFTVVREARWVPVGASAATPCDEGTTAELAYLEVTVRVSWPRLGDRPPVVMDTVMTPPKGSYSALNGHIGLKVIDRDGRPVEDVTVRAQNVTTGVYRTGQTSADGCVLLSFLDAGTYRVTLSRAGWIGLTGDPSATTTASVQAGQLWRGSLEYDAAARIDVTFRTLPDHAFPTSVGSIPVTLGNSGLQPSGTRTITGPGGSSSTRSLTNLWPYAAGYRAWAGGCLANDPGDADEQIVESEPGGTAAAVVQLAPLTITAPAGQNVTATQAKDSRCSADVSLTLGSATGGTLRTSLPYGTWTLQRSGSSTTRSVTLTPPAASATPVPATATLP